MAEARDEFIRATYSLSKVSPDAWATFIEGMKGMTQWELERMSQAPADAAAFAIGYARRLVDLRNDFIGIEKLAEKLKGNTR